MSSDINPYTSLDFISMELLLSVTTIIVSTKDTAFMNAILLLTLEFEAKKCDNYNSK